MKPIKFISIAAATAMLSFAANAAGIHVPNGPSGPLQNYCEYKCSCGDGTPSPGYIQIFISPGTSCNGAPETQALSQCTNLCTPFTPSIIYYGSGVCA
jgi:hypothetical protein